MLVPHVPSHRRGSQPGFGVSKFQITLRRRLDASIAAQVRASGQDASIQANISARFHNTFRPRRTYGGNLPADRSRCQCARLMPARVAAALSGISWGISVEDFCMANLISSCSSSTCGRSSARTGSVGRYARSATVAPFGGQKNRFVVGSLRGPGTGVLAPARCPCRAACPATNCVLPSRRTKSTLFLTPYFPFLLFWAYS